MPRNLVAALGPEKFSGWSAATGIHAGEMRQGILTDSATENRPPRSQGRGKGEKVRQELTACRVIGKARKTPSGARPNRKPRSGPLHVPLRRDRFRVPAAETNDSLRSQERRQNSAYSSSKIIVSFLAT